MSDEVSSSASLETALAAQVSARAAASTIRPDVDRSIAALTKAVTPELTRTAEVLSSSVMPNIRIMPNVESVMSNLARSVMPDLPKQVGIGTTGTLGPDMSKVGIGALPESLGIAAIPKVGLGVSKTLGLAGMKVSPDWSKVSGALSGSLSEQFKAIAGHQKDIEELLESPALARVASLSDVVARHSEELESSIAEVASAAAERNARQDAAAEATVATARAVDQLLAVSQAQQAQFGVMTGVLQTLADQGAADSAAARSRFWWGFGVGAATLAVTIAVLWLTVLMWQAAAGG